MGEREGEGEREREKKGAHKAACLFGLVRVH